MKILNILRTQPDETIKKMVKHMANGDQSMEVRLYDENIDWSKLVDDIMTADKVVCWW